jgi:hypothetical protein
VHGAWADSGSWNAVIGLLQRAGYTVYAPPNPLEGLAIDTATLADFLHPITGPTVFPGCFANGLPASAGTVLGATQRALATSTFTDQSGVPAWQTIPSWDVVGTADHIITPAEQLFMAHRAHAHITEINAPTCQ